MPDELTVGLIRERLDEQTRTAGFVLDGFPRNQAQSDALDELLRELGRELDAILFFDLSDDVATDRMLGRAGEEHRTDDTPEAIAHRLAIYHAKTEPVVEHYRVTGKLVPLHADRPADEVWVEIQQALEQVDGRGRRDHPQERPRDRADGPRRRGRRRHARAHAGAARAGHLDGSSSTAIADEYIRVAGRRPDVEGLQGLSRPRCASRRTR